MANSADSELIWIYTVCNLKQGISGLSRTKVKLTDDRYYDYLDDLICLPYLS